MVDSPEGGIRIDECSCITKFNKEAGYVEANIPKKYRNWSMTELTPEFRRENKRAVGIVERYLKNIEDKVAEGTGIWFYGPPGSAKSSIICTILKEAISKNLSAFYDSASHIISMKFSAMYEDGEARATLKRILQATDIVAIEEIDKRFMSDKTGQSREGTASERVFNEFLSDLYDANISVLVSSNQMRKEIEKEFPIWAQDRFKSLIDLPVFSFSGREIETGDD